MSATLTIPAELSQLEHVRTWIVGHLRAGGVRDAVRVDVELVVTEALANVVRHTFAGREGTIEIVVELADERLRLEITDDGPPWDGAVAAPAADGGGGYGMRLMAEVMDTVEHRTLEPTGNRLTLEKRVS